MTGTYYFDQFDVKVDMPTYTDEEYERFLQGTTIRYGWLRQLMTGRKRRQITFGSYWRIMTYDGSLSLIDTSGKVKNGRWKISKTGITVE